MNGPILFDRTLTISDAALLARQHREINACFDQYIPATHPVSLVQFPSDFNVGNHMMWVAIHDYLRRRGIRVGYTAYEYNFQLEELVREVGHGPILFLGGVSVSRLWPSHAELKRIVAAACPNNRLISLPSTMLFVDDDDRRAAGSIFGGHRDVVMMARDPVSAASAREVFPDSVAVVTVHDSAFRLPPQPRVEDPIHDIIWLAREDHESTGAKPPSDVHVFDWPTDIPQGRRLAYPARVLSRLIREAPRLAPAISPQINACYERAARHVLDNGNRLLDTGKVLVTDRLHPHVLATLRSQPCVLLPDRFGKNRAVYEYSSRYYSNLRWADTPQAALELARQLARDAGLARAPLRPIERFAGADGYWSELRQATVNKAELLQTLVDAASRLAVSVAA